MAMLSFPYHLDLQELSQVAKVFSNKLSHESRGERLSELIMAVGKVKVIYMDYQEHIQKWAENVKEATVIEGLLELKTFKLILFSLARSKFFATSIIELFTLFFSLITISAKIKSLGMMQRI